MAGTAALAAAVTLGLLRQWMWEAETWAEVVTVLLMFGFALFVLLLIPAPRRLLRSLLRPAHSHAHAHTHHHRPIRTRVPAQQHAPPPVTKTPDAPPAHHPPQPPTNGQHPKMTDAIPGRALDGRQVVLLDVGKVFVTMNLAQRGLDWPSQGLKAAAGASAWGGWRPFLGCRGSICYFWVSTAHPEAATVHPSRHSFNETTFVVVRTDESGDSNVRGADGYHYFVADVAGLQAGDGCKEPLTLPRDGDSQGRDKSSGII